MLTLGDISLEKFVNRPRYGCRWHLINNSCANPTEKSPKATKLVDSSKGLDEAGNGVRVCDVCAFLLRVQEGFAYIERCRSRCGHCPGQSARNYVRFGVVVSVFVKEVLAQFVHYEMETLEWDVHRELCTIAAVESDHAFFLVGGSNAVQPVLVGTSVDLQSLFYHISWIHYSVMKNSCTRTSSTVSQDIAMTSAT